MEARRADEARSASGPTPDPQPREITSRRPLRIDAAKCSWATDASPVAQRLPISAIAGFREIGEGWFLTVTAVDLLRAVYEQGRYEDAFILLETVDETPGPDCEWPSCARGVPARLLARRGRMEEAERLARDGVALAADSEFAVLHADVLLDLAEVLELAGRSEEARAATAEAVSIYERKGNVAAARNARRLVS